MQESFIQPKITITGDLGSGKSVVSHSLRQELGFEIYSTGKVQREIAARYGIGCGVQHEQRGVLKIRLAIGFAADQIHQLPSQAHDRSLVEIIKEGLMRTGPRPAWPAPHPCSTPRV